MEQRATTQSGAEADQGATGGWQREAEIWRQRYEELTSGRTTGPTRYKVLALLPFLVKGSLSLTALRAVRMRGFDVRLAWCFDASGYYTADDIPDFRAEDRTVDLTASAQERWHAMLADAIRRDGTRLVLQLGAAPLYRILPLLKDEFPDLAIVDALYNEVGHTMNHFLYERCFDGVIVESLHMRRFVERASLKRDPGVLVVESGVDLDLYRPAGRQAMPGPLSIGYVGRLSQEKNPLGFIDMAAVLALRFPDVQFSIAGEGPMREEVQRRLRACCARSRIRYLGYVPDSAEAIRRLDVLVVPSKLDGRPNVIMEANACGVPVIAAPVGGIPELIEDGNNGFLVPPEDHERIAGLIAGWLAEPAALDALRTSSRQVAEARFSRTRMIDAYESAVESFIAKTS